MPRRRKTEYKQGQEMAQEIGAISQVPGGIEMLMTIAAQELGGQQGGKTKQLRLYNMGGGAKYAEGGLAEAAEAVRGGGRNDDEILLHVSQEEYEALVGMWGEPDINPNTGIPEYGFLSKLWKGIKKIVKKIVKSPLFSLVAPVALNFFMPGAGAALGGMLGASGKAAAVLGNTLIRTGAGALSGGKKGALAGAVSGLTSGGVGASLGAKLGLKGTTAKIAGDALIGGAGNVAAGGKFGEGALGQAVSSFVQPQLEKSIEGGLETVFGARDVPALPGPEGMSPIPGGPEMSPIPASGDLTVLGNPQQPGFFSRAGSWIKDNPLAAAGIGAGIYGATQGGRGLQDEGPPGLPPGFNDPLPTYDFSREQVPLSDPQNYFTYGQVGSAQPGEHQFFTDNTIGMQQPLPGLDGSGRGYNPNYGRGRYQEGGEVDYYEQNEDVLRVIGGYAKGGGSGRDDTIEALLSDGEYVMDAETVAMLGDGSNDEGARRLDEMRTELRKHKGKNLARGKFSHDAKRPMEYLPKYAKGGKIKELFQIWDRKEKVQVGKLYTNLKRARTRVDKLDNEHGAYRYSVKKIKKETSQKKSMNEPDDPYAGMIDETGKVEEVLGVFKNKYRRGGSVKNKGLARQMRRAIARGET